MAKFIARKHKKNARKVQAFFLVVLSQVRTNTLKSDPLTPKPAAIREYKRQRITSRRSDRIIALYARGLSTREVAKQTGISRSTVLRILTDAGIALRPRGGHYK